MYRNHNKLIRSITVADWVRLNVIKVFNVARKPAAGMTVEVLGLAIYQQNMLEFFQPGFRELLMLANSKIWFSNGCRGVGHLSAILNIGDIIHDMTIQIIRSHDANRIKFTVCDP